MADNSDDSKPRKRSRKTGRNNRDPYQLEDPQPQAKSDGRSGRPRTEAQKAATARMLAAHPPGAHKDANEPPEPQESQDFDAAFPAAKKNRPKSRAEQQAVEQARGPLRLW